VSGIFVPKIVKIR